MSFLPATRIDTHHHIVPDFYHEWLDKRGIGAGGLPIPDWTIQGTRDVMSLLSVRRAIFSVSTPGVEPAEGAEAAAMARELNTYCHEVVQSDPDSFGYFATLALPDVDRAITELHHAYDVMGADGVVLLANSKGTYLGDPSFDPLMSELDKRSAVVFIHPSHLPGGSVEGIPAYAADFLLDTTRAAVNLCRHTVLERYPNIRFILSHGGGMIPYAAFRLSQSSSPTGNVTDGLRALRQFYYDTALTPSPFSMPALLRFAKADHILFGSDYPYAPPRVSKLFGQVLSAYPTWKHGRINHTDAEKLFPRFKDHAPNRAK